MPFVHLRPGQKEIISSVPCICWHRRIYFIQFAQNGNGTIVFILAPYIDALSALTFSLLDVFHCRLSSLP